jgi:hypothetical protein
MEVNEFNGSLLVMLGRVNRAIKCSIGAMGAFQATAGN